MVGVTACGQYEVPRAASLGRSDPERSGGARPLSLKNFLKHKITFDILAFNMKKSFIRFFSFLVFCFLVFGCKENASDRQSKVVVYTYDSFMGEWGPGPKIASLFKEKTGLEVEFVDCGDAGQILSRAVLENDKPSADILLGIDNHLAKKAISENVFVQYKPKNADSEIIQPFLSGFTDGWYLTPYDWSHFAIIYNSKSNVQPPRSLRDLTNSKYEKSLILMDPRTSTPGLGFLAWTVGIFGDKYLDFWRALKPNILTVASGWSAGYGLFTNNEAPLVISYTTSPAYHAEFENDYTYKTLIFDEGHVMQIEGAGLVRGAPNAKGGKLFLDFLISEEAQNTLPLTQWMYPVNKNVSLPDCYQKAAPVPVKTVDADPEKVEAAVKKVMAILAQ